MGGRNTEEPSPPHFCRYISLVVCMCVRQHRFATDWDNDLSRGSILCFYCRCWYLLIVTKGIKIYYRISY